MGKGGKKTKGKQSKKTQKVKNPLFEKNPKNFRIGGDIQPRRDLTRFVKWPKYILLQRQKRVLMNRLKVPPSINQFSQTIDKNQTSHLFKLLNKYQPETKADKKQRLVEAAKAKDQEEKKEIKDKKPIVIKFGLNHITTLVENKEAKLVVIANDVDPIELVLWLPQLCRKSEVPFCFVKGKANLGKLVHQKTATAVALTDVRGEDKATLEQLQKQFRTQFLDKEDLKKKWGGHNFGVKSQHKRNTQEKAREAEVLKKSKL